MRLEASASRFGTRGRTLALVMLRPVLSNGATRPAVQSERRAVASPPPRPPG
jgi:hypothetical protein